MRATASSLPSRCFTTRAPRRSRVRSRRPIERPSATPRVGSSLLRDADACQLCRRVVRVSLGAARRDRETPCDGESDEGRPEGGSFRTIAGRRGFAIGIVAALASSPLIADAAVMPDSEPTGLDGNNRLRRCPATFNCVSTSSIGGAPEQYGAAWTAKTATVEDAVAQVSAAVMRACPDARGVESFDAPNGHYLRFETMGKLGLDNVEFLVRNEGIGDRGWEGDEGRTKDWLVTYRSLATTVKYVYPFMTPVSDLGEQKKRMERIRQEVGWARVGCELEECDSDW